MSGVDRGVWSVAGTTTLDREWERWCIKVCIKSYFNQINTFQNIEIKLKKPETEYIYIII